MLESQEKSNERFEIRQVPVDKISVEGKRRLVDDEKVRLLAESIGDMGLRTPITMRADLTLVTPPA